MNQALTVGLAFRGGLSVSPPTGSDVAGPRATAASLQQPRSALAPAHSELWCTWMIAWYCLVHSSTLEQHLLDVEEVLEIAAASF